MSLEEPLKLVSQLFEEHLKSDTNATPETFDPSSSFLDILETRRDQIISFNDAHAQQIPKNTLVRFRCMIQDTGLGQEMLVSAYETRNEDGTTKLCCYRYTDDPIELHEHRVPEDYLLERTLVYCVSPPGENQWTKEAYDVYNGSLEDQLNYLSIEDDKNPNIAKKYPLPGKKHTSAIVKFYNGMDESIRVGQLVEVIGIRGQDLQQEEEANNEYELESPLHSFSNTPVLHAIAFKNLNHSTPLKAYEAASNYSVEQLRYDLVEYIASVLGGDKLAAEFVLLQLLSRVTTKINGLKIGHLTINLNGFPFYKSTKENESVLFSSTNPVSQPLIDVLENLTVHSVNLPLTIQGLNQSKFTPKCVSESLEAGVLQLVDGTMLLVDETVLDEGQLQDAGVRNFQALQTLIQTQTLGYEFPYSQYDFDTDISVLSISSNKSILPNHCSVLLKPTNPLEDSKQDMLKLSKEQLEQFRRFIHTAKHASYDIPEQVSEYIQESFVNERKKATDTKSELPTQEELMLRMSLARLAAVSFGENTLSKERYDYVVELDNQRKLRQTSTTIKHMSK